MKNRGEGRWRLAGGLTALAALLAGVTLVIFLVAGDGDTMARGMRAYTRPEYTGIPEDRLAEVAAHLTDYITGRKESFQLVMTLEGRETALFNQREILHMADCRALILLDGRVCQAALAALALGTATAGGLSLGRKQAARRAFARGGRAVYGGFLLLAAGLGLWAAVNFDGFFVTFHRAAFRNDLWLLDPRTSRLIRLMPEQLFVYLGLRGLAPALGWILVSGGCFWLPIPGKEKKR